jgi:hypothetical protein
MKRIMALAAGVLPLLCLRADATTIAGFSFDQHCERAEAVRWVRCEGSRSAWDDVRRTIYTTTTLRVLNPEGGGPAESLVLRLPGGTVRDTTLAIPGFPTFRAGEELVLFLTGRDAAGYPWPVGMAQGVYPVVRDAAGLPKVAVRQGVNPSPLAKPAGAGPAPDRIPVREFLRLARDRMRPSPPSRSDPR